MTKHWSEMDSRKLHYSVGPARAAKGKFPYLSHRSMRQVMIDEGDPALLAQITEDELVLRRWQIERMTKSRSEADAQKRRRTLDLKGLCRDCEGNSPQWITGVCHSCGNTGVARKEPRS